MSIDAIQADQQQDVTGSTDANLKTSEEGRSNTHPATDDDVEKLLHFNSKMRNFVSSCYKLMPVAKN